MKSRILMRGKKEMAADYSLFKNYNKKDKKREKKRKKRKEIHSNT